MKNHQHSALCAPEYLRSPEELAPSRAPGWLKKCLFLAASLLALLLAITLLGPMNEYVQATGEVRPLDHTLVFSPIAGVLQSSLVNEGDEVAEGQVLVRIDPWEADKRLAEIDQELLEARASLQLARAVRRKIEAVPVPPEFFFSPLEKERQREILDVQEDTRDRLEQLQKSGGVSAMEILNQRLALIATETQLKRNEQAKSLLEGPYGKASIEEAAGRESMAELRIASLETNRRLAAAERARCDVVAPAAGRVLAVTRRLPGEQIPLGVPLLKLVRGDAQELRLYASEDRLSFVKPGQLVQFQAKSNADKLARPALARVEQVAVDRDLSDSSAPAQRGSYRITARVETSSYPLPNGAEVNAEIILQKRAFWQLLLCGLDRRGK